MGISTSEYGMGTSVTQSFPWGLYVKARVLCSDGRVRATHRLASTADTFFSVPAAVKVQNRTVAGYLTFDSASGSGIDHDGNPRVAKFIAYASGANSDALPYGAYMERATPAAITPAEAPVYATPIAAVDAYGTKFYPSLVEASRAEKYSTRVRFFTLDRVTGEWLTGVDHAEASTSA